jgi:hypothetical protein
VLELTGNTMVGVRSEIPPENLDGALNYSSPHIPSSDPSTATASTSSTFIIFCFITYIIAILIFVIVMLLGITSPLSHRLPSALPDPNFPYAHQPLDSFLIDYQNDILLNNSKDLYVLFQRHVLKPLNRSNPQIDPQLETWQILIQGNKPAVLTCQLLL